jgi:hypothetical protein
MYIMMYFDNCRADQELGTVSGRSRCFSFPKHTDHFQQPPSLLLSGYWGDVLQPHNQAMNTVGVAASIVDAYLNICLYMYILLSYTYYVYTLCMLKCKRCFFHDCKINTLICSITFHKISSVSTLSE